MKKFVALGLGLALLGLFGCGMPNAPEETTAEQTTVIETTTEETTTEESTTEELEESQLPVVYSHAEIDARLGQRPGYYSVNELAKHFGEPVRLTGHQVASTGSDGMVSGLRAEFTGVTFVLWDDKGSDGKLSYNLGEDSFFLKP